MNKTPLSIIILYIFVLVSCSTDDFPTKFSFDPEKPQSGDKIEIKYKPDDDLLKSSDKIEMIVYSYGSELYNTERVEMKKLGKGWIGNYTSNDSTKGIIIKFVSDESADDNDQFGFVIKMYDDNGNEVIRANAGLASVYTRYGGTLNLTAGRDSASNYFDIEFQKNPELKREYLNQYFNSFPKSKRIQVAEEDLLALENRDNLNQNDYETLTNGFRTNRDFTKAEKYYQLLEKNYPDSRLVASRFYTRFRNMVRTDRMLEVFNEYNAINPDGDLNNYMVGAIIRKFASEDDYKTADELLNKYQKYVKSSTYNTLAWDIYEAAGDYSKADKFCIEGVKLARKELEFREDDKPVYMDSKDWENSKKYSLAMILDTHGNVLRKLKRNDESVKSLKEAVVLMDYSQPSINESYVSTLFEFGEFDEAKKVIEAELSKGKATDKMREIIQEIYLKEGKNQDELAAIIGKYDEKAKEKIKEKLMKEMLDESAPDFELLDMDGKKVKLSDYKGKTVILDFWATWCGPCLQSFPVIKKAVEKYADNPSVEFLFVNTWERVKDKKKNAEEFLMRTKYPFHVLLDDQNEVVAKYKVEGIPTKFIIDGEGKIRFKSVGFSGIEKEVLEELDIMIDMTK